MEIWLDRVNKPLRNREVDFPIITYIEYPCFRTHGWDAKYPPPEIKKLRDKNFEMLT